MDIEREIKRKNNFPIKIQSRRVAREKYENHGRDGYFCNVLRRLPSIIHALPKVAKTEFVIVSATEATITPLAGESAVYAPVSKTNRSVIIANVIFPETKHMNTTKRRTII